MLYTECRKREAVVDNYCYPCLDSLDYEAELASAELRAALDEIREQHRRDSKQLAQRYLDTAPCETDVCDEGYEFLNSGGQV